MTDDEKIYQMVERAERFRADVGLMTKLMRPVLVDIAVSLVRGETPDPKQMGMTQAQLDEVIWAMLSPLR